MEEITRKLYQESKSSDSTGLRDPGSRVYSAMELRAAASGRSNLAALLRAEAVRRKFELEQTRRLDEQHRRTELRHRDRLLRSKPAWHLVRNKLELLILIFTCCSVQFGYIIKMYLPVHGFA